MKMGFTSLSTATGQELKLYIDSVIQDARQLPDRLLEAVRALDVEAPGLPVTRYQHSLQSATRALLDGRAEEYIVAALLHDIGDQLAPYSHGDYCAAIFKPYMSERMCWIVQTHPTFQVFHYGHKLGIDRNARDVYRDHPWYQDAIEFSAMYDNSCFDPEYEAKPLEVFEPMVRRIFAVPRFRATSLESLQVQ